MHVTCYPETMPMSRIVRVKLSVLNENATKHFHLHLDPSQSPSRHMGSSARKITQ